MIKQLVLASNNQGKIAELSALLSPHQIEIIPQSQFNIEDIEETGTTFVENAILKAKHAAKMSGLPALADDSGLVVPALGGAPGIYSARYAQTTLNQPKSDKKNNEKLLRELGGVSEQSNRQAAFVCVIALCLSENHPLPIISEGIWYGEIALAAHGNGGFGYDPLFFVPSHGVTAAELEKTEKNRISHRGLALKNLMIKLKQMDSMVQG